MSMESGHAPFSEPFSRSCFSLGPGERSFVTVLLALASWLIWWWDFWDFWSAGAPLERPIDYVLIGLLSSAWVWWAGNRVAIRVDPADGTLTAQRLWLWVPIRSASFPLAEVSMLRIVDQRGSSTSKELVIELHGEAGFHISLGDIGSLGQQRIERLILRPTRERLREQLNAGRGSAR